MMSDESSQVVTGGLIAAAIYAVGRYIRGRITGADTDKDKRIDDLEKKVDKLCLELKSLHSHVMLLESFRTSVLMLANTSGVCISPESIIRLSQDIDKKIQEMNA
jgi:hypothetical protein